MNNDNPNAGGTELPQAEVRPNRQRRISSVWVIPVLAALLAGGLAWRTLSERGPTITLSLQSADGLEAGKTIVSYRSVPVGTVEDIALSDDIKSVLVTIQMRASSRSRLNKDSKFWVVRPRMGVAGISGLSTLTRSTSTRTPRSGMPVDSMSRGALQRVSRSTWSPFGR